MCSKLPLLPCTAKGNLDLFDFRYPLLLIWSICLSFFIFSTFPLNLFAATHDPIFCIFHVSPGRRVLAAADQCDCCSITEDWVRLLAGHHRPPVVDTPVIVSKVMDSLFSVSAAPEGIRCSFQSKEFRILSFLCTYKLHCWRVYLVYQWIL